MDTQKVFLFVAIGLVIFGFGFIVEQSYEENLTRETVTNETVNVSAFDTPIALDNSNIEGARYEDTITAWNSTDTKLSEGTDYVWHDSNGTIEFVSGSPDLSLGEDVKVSYDYDEPSDLQYGILNMFDGWLPIILLVLAAFAALSIKEELP